MKGMNKISLSKASVMEAMQDYVEKHFDKDETPTVTEVKSGPTTNSAQGFLEVTLNGDDALPLPAPRSMPGGRAEHAWFR